MATASAVSQMLGKSYVRSVKITTDYDGVDWNTGFVAKQLTHGLVAVTYRFGCIRNRTNDVERAHMVKKYSSLLEHRYSVEFVGDGLVVADKSEEV